MSVSSKQISCKQKRKLTTYKHMPSLHFQLVTPERELLNTQVDSISCPTAWGQITILPNHTALVATLAPGELITRSGKEENFINVAGGFVQVRPGSEVVVLADAAEHFYEIDESKAQAARERAKQILAASKTTDQEYARAAASLEKSLARLHILRKHARRRGFRIQNPDLNQ